MILTLLDNTITYWKPGSSKQLQLQIQIKKYNENLQLKINSKFLLIIKLSILEFQSLYFLYIAS